MDISERLIQIIENKNITPAILSNLSGVSESIISRIINKETVFPRQSTLEKLAKVLQVDSLWLLTGNYEIKDIPPISSAENPVIYGDYRIPLLPITAHGGSLSVFSASIQRYQCETIISPIENAEMAIVVRGESMEPEYKEGSIVLLRRIQHEVYIDWGSVYIIDTTNGSILKQVAPGSREELIRLHSFNSAPEYADYEIQKSIILAMYKVIFVMAAKSY